MRQLKRANLYEQIADEIRDYIIRNQIKPGERLPTERELAEILGVSRTSVREGIRLLETLQFLEVMPKRGITVKKLELSPLVEQISHRILLERSRFAELVEARRCIELEMVKLTAARATDEDLQQMMQAILAMEEKLARNEESKEEDLLFHKIIFAAAKNSVLHGFRTALVEFFNVVQVREEPSGLESETLREHKLIYQAIQAHDPHAAYEVMVQHLKPYDSYLKEKEAEE